MHRWGRRFASLIGALVILLGSAGVSSAQTTDTVSVSGQVAPAPLNISIATDSVNFGNIDYKATSQGASPAAQGFEAQGGGAYWTAVTPIVINVSSPNPWTGQVCRDSGSNVPEGGIRLLGRVPQDQQEASADFGGNNVIPTCSGNLTWLLSGSTGSTTTTKYIGTWVQSTDQLGTLSTRLTFSVTT